MSDIQRALEIAVQAHKGQLQKNGLPYILHPLTVMHGVHSVDEKIAAILHDVVEDTAWTLQDLVEEGFAVDVVNAIECLTHRAEEPYEDYIERVATNPIARNVKRADLHDNMNILRIPAPSKSDLNRLTKYHKAWFRLADGPE